MSSRVHPERVNDVAKLIMHRLIARAIGRDPSLVEKAKDILAQWTGGYSYVDDWNDILTLSPIEIRQALTRRDENMTRLRLSSPFAFVKGIDFANPDLRRRIWRDAHQMTAVSVGRAGHDRMAA
jgi:hypothetical protein